MLKILDKIESNKDLIVMVLLVGFFILLKTEFVFADDSVVFAKEILTTILNALIGTMFVGGGILLLIFGGYELIVSMNGQNPDAKNKAVLNLGSGVVLIVLGVAFMLLIERIVNFLIS